MILTMETESVEFSAKYKTWVVIRKTSIYPDTTPEEVVFAIAGIRQSIDKKTFELLGIDTISLDSYATSLANGAKKTYLGLSEILTKLGNSDSKKAIETAVSGKPEHEGIAKTYLFRKIVQLLNLEFDVSQEALSKIYPNLKIPKQRGRKPKE